MLILSNALTNVVDEGCVKVANSLVKRIKKTDEATFVVAFERQSDIADEYMTVNKLLLNRKLISKIRKNKGKVMYIPFPAKPLSTALRILILSFFAGKDLKVMLCMTTTTDTISKFVLKMSRAKLMVFSKSAFDFYSKIVGEKRVKYIKAGVDTEKFMPVSKERAKELKEKYGFDANKKLVLHVGHLNEGRNISELMKISSRHQVLLVSSSLTKYEQDIELKKRLISCGIKIIDTYIADIEQVYQMADVYFFPVVEEGRCIDVPLSCMEAAACNKPIVTTDFGEMKEFAGRKGFYFIDIFDENEINSKIDNALGEDYPDTRSAVLDYDWENAITYLKD